MPEWWTYSLSDFLMFSPRVYYRLFELYNGAVWPAHLVALGLGFAVLYALARPSWVLRRAAALALAAIWVWIAWGFFWQRYAEVNWPAAYVAPAFALQGLMLAGFALFAGVSGIRSSAARPSAAAAPSPFPPASASWLRQGLSHHGVGSATPGRSPAGAGGGSNALPWLGAAALFAAALLLYPAIAPLMGRSWMAAEVFGLAPDPTAIATLAFLAVTSSGWQRWLLMLIPVLWCLLSATTLSVMGAPEFFLPALGAFAAAAIAAVNSVDRQNAEKHPKA